MVLFDLTAAFDTIEHEDLKDLLDLDFGIRDLALAWLASYLGTESDSRTESVVIDGVTSKPVRVVRGVPQGSVVGPELFIMYVNSLRKVAEQYGVSIHQFSDDTTIYLEFCFPPECPDLFDALRILSSCAGDLVDWFAYNWVKLNPPKSDCLYCAPAELADKLPLIPLRVGEHVLPPSDSARVLGVMLSSDMSMDKQISAVTKAANFNLYRLGKIRSHLTTEATKILAHALVISRIDYANSLLAGLPKSKIKPLQSVQDSAARLIHRGSYSSEESRFRLHWLPVTSRILFKILLLVFDCLQGLAPAYLQKAITLHIPGRSGLRSNARSLEAKAVKSSRRKKRRSRLFPSYQRRSFTTFAPVYWNVLPAAVRSTTNRGDFKRLLKTHLFTLSYPSYVSRLPGRSH